jgi:LPS-assembly lipoprotein
LSLNRSFRRLAIAAGIAAVAVVSGCQVRPLYSESGGVGQRLASVGFSDPHSRIDQVVRNNLIFLTSGGAGEAARPEYEVKLSATSTASSILDITSDDNTVSVTNTPIAGRVEVQVTYTLSRVADGQVLKSATREIVSQIDVSGQNFAKLRAIRDAENRASREAAEFIRAEIAIVLAREPQPQTVWQK